jgi:O-antigen ligase
MATSQAPAIESPLIRYSRWCLALTIGATPLYIVTRFGVRPFRTDLLEILILLTVALYVGAHLRTWSSWRPIRSGLEVPTALLLFAGLMGIAVSTDHVGALGFYRAYFIEPIVLFYVAVDLLRTPSNIRTVLFGFAIGTTIFSILNLGAWVVALERHVDINLGNAPEALYTSPNSVAIYMEPAVAIAAGFVLYADDRRDRNVALVWLAFVLASMIATLSRAGMLTLAVLVLVAVITMRSTRLKLAILGSGLVAAIAVFQIPFVSKRLYRQFDPSYPYNTFEGRLQIWSDTLKMLRDRPIFGSGLRAYETVMQAYVAPGHKPELYPHNLFLAMWVELGLLGLIAFVVLLGLLLWRGWTAYAKAHGFAKALLWGTSAAFVAIAVHGMFDTPYYNNDISVEFWFVAALEVAAIAFLVRPTTRKPSMER